MLAVAVAQLVEGSILILGIRGSYPNLGKILSTDFTFEKKKRPRKAHL